MPSASRARVTKARATRSSRTCAGTEFGERSTGSTGSTGSSEAPNQQEIGPGVRAIGTGGLHVRAGLADDEVKGSSFHESAKLCGIDPHAYLLHLADVAIEPLLAPSSFHTTLPPWRELAGLGVPPRLAHPVKTGHGRHGEDLHLIPLSPQTRSPERQTITTTNNGQYEMASASGHMQMLIPPVGEQCIPLGQSSVSAHWILQRAYSQDTDPNSGTGQGESQIGAQTETAPPIEGCE